MNDQGNDKSRSASQRDNSGQGGQGQGQQGQSGQQDQPGGQQRSDRSDDAAINDPGMQQGGSNSNRSSGEQNR